MVSRLFSFEKDRGAFIRGGAFNREYTVHVCDSLTSILDYLPNYAAECTTLYFVSMYC